MSFISRHFSTAGWQLLQAPIITKDVQCPNTACVLFDLVYFMVAQASVYAIAVIVVYYKRGPLNVLIVRPAR